VKKDVDFEGPAAPYLKDERGHMNSQEAIAALREEIAHNHAQIERLEESNARQRTAARALRALCRALESAACADERSYALENMHSIIWGVWGVK